MGSCKIRTLSRSVTIPQFEALGIKPKVFLSPCSPAGPEQNRAVALQAIRYAAKRKKTTLYIEDDINIDPILFPWALDLATSLDAVTYLYLNDTPARMRQHYGRQIAKVVEQQSTIVRGAYAIRKPAALFGTQAVLIPARLMPEMIEILENNAGSRTRMPWDGRLHTWVRANRHERVYSILPHPVQHRQDRTGRPEANHVMRSMSYGIPWVDAGSMPFRDEWFETQRHEPVTRTRETIALAFTSRRQQRDHE